MPSGDVDSVLILSRQEVKARKPLLHFSGLVSMLSVFQFLFQVQAGWVQALEASPSASDSSVKPSTGPAAPWWPSLCLELGSLLQVNPDILRRQLVCELFSQGLDLRAQQVLPSLWGLLSVAALNTSDVPPCLTQAMLEVEDQDVLGSQLLVLSGQRLSYTLLHSQSQNQPAMELLARLPPTLCAWLKAMVSTHTHIHNIRQLLRRKMTELV